MKNEFMKRTNILREKTSKFAIRIVKLCQYLRKEKKEFVLSNQVLRSGTSIGALVRESEFAQSTADFISKLSISLKEANETDYWLSILHDTEYIELKLFESLASDCKEILSIFIVSVKTSKERLASERLKK